MNNDFLEAGKLALATQPFSKLMQAELKVFAPGKVVLEIPIKDNLLQQHQFVHGGVISYAADNALTFVGGSVLGPQVLTSEYKINYVRPAFGEKLIARAEVVYASRRQAVCRCDVFALAKEEERLCATALGTIASTAAQKDE